MAGNTRTPGATVTARVLAVLSAFDKDHPQLALSSIARRADLPLSTTHRLVAELVSHRALAMVGREYVVGRRIWDIGLLAPVQETLRDAASPFLHDIYAATLATVQLAVRDGDSVLYLERLAGRASVPVVSKVGSRLPMYATGVGKVLLAHAPDDVRRRVLADLVPMTPFTVTDPQLLEEQLAGVRREGFSATAQEMTLGACSAAVPIRQRNTIVAALGVVVPSLEDDRGRLIAALQVAARGIGRQL
ncbi:IclR family transcriptional regulator [Nocardioides insulae]|uniref:IclR family transcriptional regulator n=1 Tax=Nocardioides insulae TaxID=394734 RepID=UPI0004903727|nr:IclR family transcriptional regulator [Nocardioides insulae]